MTSSANEMVRVAESDPRIGMCNPKMLHHHDKKLINSLGMYLTRDRLQVAHLGDLEIDEGDNAPLPIAGAQLLLPSQALRFYHPGDPLTLVYGNVHVAAPRYDLALLGPRLFGEAAHEVNLGASRTAEQPESQLQKRLFWIVIAAAVLVLLIILARLIGGGRAHPEERR